MNTGEEILYFIEKSENLPLDIFHPSLIPHIQSPQITFTVRVARTIVPHSGQTYLREPVLAFVPTFVPTVPPLTFPTTGTTIGRSFRQSCIS